jgi:microcystin-dependent protein
MLRSTKSRITAFLMGAIAAVPAFGTKPAAAQAGTPFVGQMMLTGTNFCPRAWARADGQLLPIAQNTALFSLLGTTYGGDGRTSFGLPDLRGRAPIGQGSGPGLSTRTWGQKGGAETHT